MPILGINYEKCNNCQNCYNACTRYFRRDREQNKIVFKDPNNSLFILLKVLKEFFLCY